MPLGSARVDRFFKPTDKEALRQSFLDKYPQCKGKKIILYAPTFRDVPERDALLMENFDLKKFKQALGEEYVLLIRLHPQVHSCDVCSDENIINMTGYNDVGTLVQVSDLLITDYSSICMDFAILNKPCLFYAFDLQEYEDERSFFFDYEDYVPGTVAKTFDELLDCIKNKNFSTDKQEKFRAFNFDYLDDKSTKRIVDTIVK